ncbi:MAG: calcium-binding protein [Microcoleus sp. PH2017_29_MFU_D_A]|jgi:Ca2+-binding RTX toxin-like protein|uniref:calcium-binding protein n=1 Tax=unclassified Microcoleus TaxID=2642155 RepID=UPI001D98B679|nr:MULTISPECIES: calcium-binding protein [unclassified Microcoleus]MCC3420852.1 calcium-binding protein [Microcoleus sp. PH2017_07_MST_O_A]MCC3432207.1 calcium-binding protein [Microcoleus sp. PH2017_04_SCI_O_A]MCC3443940.1 calcium-binding protein [Microcoleus sp. PH2017_03_ELD_O_A]MCC3468740.1 calcium-binding protein [Microcoleus sp. PH2017_06_SFM_O_A]MCC3504129.1 calcium-binding protein [Microcoleus sp. PH2017_19_SFW_U_A]MCC3508535.1 calcium-binding protein [Microcoleus sp. PH2017_17_BER_D_
MANIDIANTPNAQGTEGDDVIRDTDGGRRTLGLGGNDRIFGRGGNDELFGNLGRDSLDGEGGFDTLYGGKDADSLDGGLDDDILFGNAGTDTVRGGSGNDQIFGGRDNDWLLGGDGEDILSGDLGFDVLTGGSGRDRFIIQDEVATNTVDFLNDFFPGEDKIVLPKGLTFADIEVLTFQAAGLNPVFVERQFEPSPSPFNAISSGSDLNLALRVKSTNRIIGLLDRNPTSGVRLTAASLTAADFISS